MKSDWILLTSFIQLHSRGRGRVVGLPSQWHMLQGSRVTSSNASGLEKRHIRATRFLCLFLYCVLGDASPFLQLLSWCPHFTLRTSMWCRASLPSSCRTPPPPLMLILAQPSHVLVCKKMQELSRSTWYDNMNSSLVPLTHLFTLTLVHTLCNTFSTYFCTLSSAACGHLSIVL